MAKVETVSGTGASIPAEAEASSVARPAMDWIHLLGVRISKLTEEEAVERLHDFIRTREPHLVVTADSFAIVTASEDEEFRRILKCADMVTPDSTGIVWASRRLGCSLPERVSGVDLAERMCELAARQDYSVFLYGAAPGVADAAAANLRARYPALRIAGTAHGFIPDAEQEALLARIESARPDILLAALGIPRQEKWIYRHMQRLRVPVSIGVGGSFDVFAGRVSRAPAWMQRHGMEWAYRLFKNPRKIAKVRTLPRFVLMVMRYRSDG
jgi:N-acetylglucosaminyldiphosphoundecaprenol N-acetyl-beta-D-mannosaminyltransferase